jgi:hypothetical protein
MRTIFSKPPILGCLLLLVLASASYSQCVGDSVCVKQSTIDRAAQVATELIEARDVIKKFESERIVTAAEKRAATALIDSLNALVATGHRIQEEQGKVIALYKQVVEMQQSIIEKLEKMLNKPKSAWAKFLDALKTVAAIAFGVGLGRGL